MEQLLTYMMNYGPWAVLFSVLLWYVLKANEKRENRYIGIIESLSKTFEEFKTKLSEISVDVKELKKGKK